MLKQDFQQKHDESTTDHQI